MFDATTTQLIAYRHWERRGRPLADDWTDWFWAEHLLGLASNLEVAVLVAEDTTLWECLPPRDSAGQPGIPAGLDPRDIFTFAQAKLWVEQFENILRKYGMDIERGSILEDIWLEVAEMEQRRSGTSPVHLKQDMRYVQRRALGLVDIARRVVRVDGIGRLEPLLGHLQLLSKCDFAQNVESEGGWGKQLLQEYANKAFELLIGLVISELAPDVTLEVAQGKKSKESNPDVVGTIMGEQWGFACKVLSTTAPRTIIQHVEKGCEQLSNAKVDKGLVVINLKNVLKHDQFWDVLGVDGAGEVVYSALPSERIAVEKMDAFVDSLASALRDELSPEDVEDIFSEDCLIPSIIIVMQTALVVLKAGKTIPTTLGRLARIPIVDEIGVRELEVIEFINRVFQHRPPMNQQR